MKRQIYELKFSKEQIQLKGSIGKKTLILEHTEILALIIEKARKYALKNNIQNNHFFIKMCIDVYNIHIYNSHMASDQEIQELYNAILLNINLFLDSVNYLFCSETTDNEIILMRARHEKDFESNHDDLKNLMTSGVYKIIAENTQKKINYFFK